MLPLAPFFAPDFRPAFEPSSVQTASGEERAILSRSSSSAWVCLISAAKAIWQVADTHKVGCG